ncbi:MAG: hypothetical protein ACT4PV_09245 [Planctomycetaceae bacterium]
MSDPAMSPEAEIAPSVPALSAEGLREFVRCLFASTTALLADAGTLALLPSVRGVPCLLSGAIAFAIGLTILTLLGTPWVRSARRERRPLAESGIIALAGSVGRALGELGPSWLTGGTGVDDVDSKTVGAAVVFGGSPPSRKRLLFRLLHA